MKFNISVRRVSMKKEGFLYEFKKNKALFAMAAPAFILVLVMQY